AAFSGQTMTVTPAVTPDRRYVRLSVNAYFNVLNGFQSFTTPLAAVGGPVTGGGGSFNAGMNGVIGPSQFGDGNRFAAVGLFGPFGGLTGAPLPHDGGLADGSALLFANGLGAGPAMVAHAPLPGGFTPERPRARAFDSPSEASRRHGVTAALTIT